MDNLAGQFKPAVLNHLWFDSINRQLTLNQNNFSENEFLPYNYVILTASTILIFISKEDLSLENSHAEKLAVMTGENKVF